ncbi:MAG: HAD-IA family hydrolase [Candidatus Micrarchaeaceae archaeon]
MLNENRIKLIIFDANKVIYDLKNAFKYFNSAFVNFLKAHGVTDIENVSKSWGEFSNATELGKMSIQEAHRQYLSKVGIPETYLNEYEKLDSEAFKKAELTEPNIRETLSRLKNEGYKLAILSNTGRTPADLEVMFKYLNIDGLFDKIFVSSEIHHKKPDKESYQAVMDYFSCRPDETVFVGHDKVELVGAKNLGIKTISYKGDPAGDMLVQSFYEIPESVSKLQ